MNSPVITTHPLGGGVTLRHIATDRFKTARLSLVTVRPADPRESPLGTLLFGVLRRGGTRYPRLTALNRALDELYGTTLCVSNYLHGDNHVLAYSADLPEGDFLPADAPDLPAGVLALLADLWLHPLTDGECLRAQTVEAEKVSLCDSLCALRNDPRTYASNRFCELMCAGEPYGLSVGGTVDAVARITAADVTDCHRRHLATVNATLIYVGRAPAESIIRAWEAAFGGWSPAALPLTHSSPHRAPAERRFFEEALPLSQGKLCMGWACGENDSTLTDPREIAALCLVSELFGGMQSARLFRTVREERGLCYSCDSALDLQKGILSVSAGIRPDRLEETVSAIDGEWSAICTGEITPHEVELARVSLLARRRATADSQAALEFSCLRGWLSGSTVPYDALTEALESATVADVVAAARRFAPDTTYFLRGTAAGGEGEPDA